MRLFHIAGAIPVKVLLLSVGYIVSSETNSRLLLARGGGVLPYMGYIGMCGPKGYGFSAVLVINRVSILADFGHFGHK